MLPDDRCAALDYNKESDRKSECSKTSFQTFNEIPMSQGWLGLGLDWVGWQKSIINRLGFQAEKITPFTSWWQLIFWLMTWKFQN